MEASRNALEAHLDTIAQQLKEKSNPNSRKKSFGTVVSHLTDEERAREGARVDTLDGADSSVLEKHEHEFSSAIIRQPFSLVHVHR